VFYISERSLWLLCGKWITKRQSTEADDGGLVEGGFEKASERGANRIGDGETGYGG